MPGMLSQCMVGTVLAFNLAGSVEAHEDVYRGHQFTTRHSGTFNGMVVEYTATFGETVVANAEGEPTASIYSADYTADDVADEGERPVIFFWQGGPSAPASAIHVNGFGPRRLAEPVEGDAGPIAFRDSEATLLDVADLVFVDPAGTGFSRILPAGSQDQFFSAPGDAESMTLFVRNWLRSRDRESSPVYLAGTSYGSIRVAIMAGWFVHYEMPLSGLLLFSQGVNLVETTQRANNLVGYATNISQLASVAWYHGRTARQDRSVFDVIDEAYDFSMGEYLAAIAMGSTLPRERKRELAGTLSELTGISESFYIEHDLLINKHQFRTELLKARGLVIGASDGRSTRPVEPPPETSAAPVESPVHYYLREELTVDLPFEKYVPFVAGGDNGWDYVGSSTLSPDGSPVPLGSARTVFADFNYSRDIAAAFEAYEGFRVFIATGIHDLLTTAGPARLLASNTSFPPERIELHEYEGGHSFYGNDDEFDRLTTDIRRFLERR